MGRPVVGGGLELETAYRAIGEELYQGKYVQAFGLSSFASASDL